MLEILITVLITFIMFLLMYRTFFGAYRIADGVTEHLDRAEIRFALFRQFAREASSVIRDLDSFEGRSDSLTFLCETAREDYPVQTTYQVRRGDDDLMELWQSRKSPIYNRSYAFPVLGHTQEIAFSYWDGENWTDDWDGDKFPEGIALRIVTNGREYFLPVKTGDTDEQAEQK